MRRRRRCGHDGSVCRRTALVDVGGFPTVPLMEHVECFRRLHRYGRVVHSKKRIVVSPRRYEAIGAARLTFAYGFIATLYVFGVPLSVLARMHQYMCCAAHEPEPSPA